MTDDQLALDIDLSGLEEVTADMAGFPTLLGREMTTAMDAGLQFLKGQIKVRTPVNEGKLEGSINHQIISPFPNLAGLVGSPLPYSIVVEKGRRPGQRMPPVDALAIWAIRVLKVSRDESERVGWALAKHIAKHGFSPEGQVGPKGARMFEEGLKASELEIQKLFDNAIARSVRQMNQ